MPSPSTGGGSLSDDLAEARHLTAKFRGQEPGLLVPAPQESASRETRFMTTHEAIAETWREVREWKRKHMCYSGSRVLFSVPVR